MSDVNGLPLWLCVPIAQGLLTMNHCRNLIRALQRCVTSDGKNVRFPDSAATAVGILRKNYTNIIK